MQIEELRKKLRTMTQAELECREKAGQISDLGSLEADYGKEAENYVFFETGLNRAPVNMDGYQDAAKNFDFLNVVVSKHTRYSIVPPHRHEFVEMLYMLSGSVDVVINGKKMRVVSGDLCIMDSDVVHSVGKTEKNDLMINILMPKRYFNTTFLTTLINVQIVTGFLGNIISQKTAHDKYWLVHCEGNEDIRYAFEKIFCEFLEPTVGSASAIRYHIGLILIEGVRHFKEEDEPGREDNGKSVIPQVLQYIDEHCVTCTLKDTADHFGYSATYLSKKLKQRMGKSFQELISEQRLNRVALMLVNTDTSIFEIAVNCGYQNMAFFYQKFSQKFGMTPKEYRNQVQANR